MLLLSLSGIFDHSFCRLLRWQVPSFAVAVQLISLFRFDRKVRVLDYLA
jgi:hypothetical protein